MERKHSTDNEIQFLRRIGEFSRSNSRLGQNKLTLLRNYQQSMFSRVDWDGMNVRDVQREVIALIEREEILS